jgi:hypothetical protein
MEMYIYLGKCLGGGLKFRGKAIEMLYIHVVRTTSGGGVNKNKKWDT